MKCEKCGKKIGMFGKSYECDDENCKMGNLCEDCAKVCNKCGNIYCSTHIIGHECEPTSETEEEDDKSEDEEDEIVTYVGKNKEYLIIDIQKTGSEVSDDIEEVIKAEEKGYEIEPTLTVAYKENNGTIIMKKKTNGGQ